MSKFTEEQVTEIRKEFKDLMEDYFAMRRPGFNIESNFQTKGHGTAEFAVSTDTNQGLHFYQSGNSKYYANKSIELYSGKNASDEDVMTIVLDAINGNIKITAANGDLILQGANVKIEALDADGDVSINTKKTVTVTAPEFNVGSTKTNLSSTSDMLLNAGSLSLYSETGSVMSATGQEPIIAPSILQSIINFAEKAKTLGRTLGA